MILNERILQVVLALAEELHFGRAAVRLHVSQPALSGTIRGLERDLGIRLFRRTSRHVELTEAGRVLAGEARRLIAEGQRAISLVRNSAPEIVGPLRIAYSPSIDLRWFGGLISGARDVQLCSAVPLIEGLLDRTLHAALYCGRTCHPDLRCVTLFRYQFAAVMTEPQRPSVSFEELADEDVVWLRRDADAVLSDAILAQCAGQGYRPRIAHWVSTFAECLEFARAGLGITFLPHFLEPAQPDGSIVFARTTLSVECGIAYHRNTRSEELDNFIKLARHQSLPVIDRQKQTIDILALPHVELCI